MAAAVLARRARWLPQDLHMALARLEQRAVDFAGMDRIAQSLVRPVLLNHKDHGVAVYAACCLAHLFRLYADASAPTLPFPDSSFAVRGGDASVGGGGRTRARERAQRSLPAATLHARHRWNASPSSRTLHACCWA